LFVKLGPSANRAVSITQIKEEITRVNSDFTVFELDEVLQVNLDFLGSIWSTVMLLPLFSLTSAALCLIGYSMLGVEEQRQEFAILRAMGAKPKTVVAILAVQSIIVLFSSFAVGISLGVIITLMILIPHPIVTSFIIAEIAGWLFTALTIMLLLSLCPAIRFANKPILKIMS
jgi:ABC-type antimicrobial peptide transport system permease subunit